MHPAGEACDRYGYRRSALHLRYDGQTQGRHHDASQHDLRSHFSDGISSTGAAGCHSLRVAPVVQLWAIPAPDRFQSRRCPGPRAIVHVPVCRSGTAESREGHGVCHRSDNRRSAAPVGPFKLSVHISALPDQCRSSAAHRTRPEIEGAFSRGRTVSDVRIDGMQTRFIPRSRSSGHQARFCRESHAQCGSLHCGRAWKTIAPRRHR